MSRRNPTVGEQQYENLIRWLRETTKGWARVGAAAKKGRKRALVRPPRST